MGFEDTNPIINMGQSGFFLFLMLIWMIIVLLVPIICRCQSKTCLKLREKATGWKKGFLTLWIRLFVEIFADMVIAGCIRMKTFELGTTYEKGLTIFSVIMLIFCLGLLIAFSVILYKNRDDYENKEFQEKYGELLADVNPHSAGAAFFWIAFMLQRIVQIVIVVFLQGYAVF